MADSSNAYGGATTDDNSVNISVTGITADGENFAARVDFAVPIKVDNHNVIHPFVLLEQSGDEWTAVIPRAVLMATKDCRNKLPLQLVLANDSQVINSRNTIVLDVTQGIDADTEGSELPEYVVPEWEIPEGTVSEDEDVHVIEVTYDPETRMLALDNENSKYGGATIDTRSVKIQISGIVPDGADFGARVDFAVPIMVDERRILKPFVVLENINNVWCAMVPQAVLMAAHDIKKLPFQLVTRHGETVINSRNTIALEITRAINAMESTIENYAPYIMYRNDTWGWIEDFTYDTGAVVTYDGDIYVATQPSMGQRPSIDSEYWEPSVGETIVTLNGHRINDPEFYAPLLSGTSGQYLESRGDGNSPEWVTKVTEITVDSNLLPTVTAVKNYVSDSVAVETDRAMDAESQLQSDISSEAYEREMADGSLRADIGLEKERATGAERLLQQGVEFAMSSITRVENELSNAIITEKNRAERVEGTLDDKIDQEISDRATAITQAVGAESAERESADRTLEEAISNEAGVRASADTGLSDRISTLETETVDDGGRYLTKTDKTLDHDLTTRSNSTDTAILTNGGTATFIDSLSSNETGHVTASNTKTVTLPKVTAGTGLTVTNDDLPSPDTGKAIIVGHTNNITPNTNDVGNATTVPIIRNDSEGHLTKVSSALIDIPTSQVTKLTGYVEASSEGQLNVNDTLNQALGKIQKGINSKAKTNHADGTTQYGQASTSLYGHVKIITATNTPSGTSNENVPTEAKMAEFVNSSIASQTGKFIGTVDAETDLGLTLPTTDTLIANALLTYYQSSSPTNNDYCYVTVDTEPSTPSKDEFRRFKYNGTSWQYEYTLNNSSFTQTQWATINSLLTNRSYGTGNEISLDVVDIDANITASTTHIADTDIHVTTQNKTDWDAKYDKPSTGIPKTDLAQAVQDSLGLADSALQTHQAIKTINSTTMVGTGNINLQVPLVGSGTGQNIKTVGGTNILGTGDINPVTKTAIESALNVSGTYNNQALIVKNGVLDFGEAGKVDEIQINGTKIAPLNDSKVANIVTGAGLVSSTNTIKAKLKSETNATNDSNTITNTSNRQYAVVPDKTNGYLSVNVPWTDENVKQIVTNNNYSYRIACSYTWGGLGTEVTSSIYVPYNVFINPSTGRIQAPHFYNSTTSSSLDFIVGSIISLTEVD